MSHSKPLNTCFKHDMGKFASLKLCRLAVTELRTSDSLHEGLPIKMTRKVSKKMIFFSMKKIVGSTLDLSIKAVFSLDKYQLKNMG